MYNTILEKIIMPFGDLLNASSYIQQLNYWRNVDTFSVKDLEALQQKKLQSVLQHAVNHVPYYKELFSGKKEEPTLTDFPVIDKFLIRNQLDNLLSNQFDKKDLIPYSSSGSTGVQTTVFMTKKEQSIIRGILTHWWEWSGYKMGSHLVQTGITPNRGFVKSLKDKFFRTLYINAFSHTKEQLKALCDQVSRKPQQYYFAGYASSLNVIAEFALDNGYDLQACGAISLGDKLFDGYKRNIKKAFQCKVYDTYGSNEGFMIAAQDDLDYYYILSPHVYVEILDDDHRPVPDGEMGNIVVTRLDGFSMPLIRYKIGDLGILLPKENYPNERNYSYPLLQQVVGRETDIIILPDDSKLVVHSFTGIFEYIPEIKQFKVIQEDRKGITIEYIKSAIFTPKALEKVETELSQYIKDDFEIKFKEVAFIAPSKSGKPQIVESRLKK